MIDKFDQENLEHIPYEISNDLGVPKGISGAGGNDIIEDPKDNGISYLRSGKAYGSLVNKLHLIKLVNLDPDDSKAYTGANKSKFEPKTFSDLCTMSGDGAPEYDAEDFIYCKKLNFPINRLITLRRFPKPCTDNIYSSFNQAEPDISRMVTYFDQDVNKLEDILSFSYGMKWKQLTAEMEQASAIGDQSGFTNLSKKVMSVLDPTLAQNALRGENKLNYDPKHDQNKVYGPVDSITETHIRDVGLEFTKEFDLQFDYELRSWNGRTPEFAFKDLIANILATTYNNAKFWGGSRYWVGERPSRFIQKMNFMQPDTIEEFFGKGFKTLKDELGKFKGADAGTNAISALKNALKNGLAIGIGKLLDNVGRPSILVMNSLLTGEPTGFWHVTIGNPDNPIMCIGNLICTGVDVKFPTDSLSYGDFPTKLQVNVKLKPAQPKDKAGIETMFNLGKSRIYYNPKSVKKNSNNEISRRTRRFMGITDDSILSTTANDAFDFLAKNVDIAIDNVKSVGSINPATINKNNSNPLLGIKTADISFNKVRQNAVPLSQ